MVLRSNKSTQGKRMAGARSLWLAAGMKREQIGKPIIAIVNSFTQFVPGHTHLHSLGQEIKARIESNGFYAAEFNTIAIDDGIAMGHSGMLYSLPSRDLIADSIEYMVNAHCVDAMICISNCDKITPGMLMASMRLNIPTVLVSGGPMEAGKINSKHYDLVDVMVNAAKDDDNDEFLSDLENTACPTCGSCAGMFTANSMNCLAEALGLALPGNGTLLATHVNRKKLVYQAADTLVKITKQHYDENNTSVLPRSIVTRESLENAMRLDIAMGGSSNTVLHLLAIAYEAGIDFNMQDIDELSKSTPHLCKVSPSSDYHIQDVHRAGGVPGILSELMREKLLNLSVKRLLYPNLEKELHDFDIMHEKNSEVKQFFLSAPGYQRSYQMGSQENYYEHLDNNRNSGCIRSIKNAYSQDGGLAVLYGNIAQNGCIVKTAGVYTEMFKFTGKTKVFDSQESAVEGILHGEVQKGEVVIIRYEGPKGGPGMQEMLYPTSYLKSLKLEKDCALITDGRFSGGTSGLSIGHVSPEAAAGGNIALVKDGDTISIDIPERQIHLHLSESELLKRRKAEMGKKEKAFQPKRKRHVSNALKAYSAFVTSADKGSVKSFNNQ